MVNKVVKEYFEYLAEVNKVKDCEKFIKLGSASHI